MSLTRLVLRFAAPVPQVESFQRYLFVGPHPDDIEIGAGATAAKLTAAGKRVTFLVCTDGRFGLEHAPQGTTPEELVGLRKAEAIASAQALGVTDVRFLDFSDGGFYDFETLVKAMAQIVGDVQPELIFAPDPDVTSECHIDHRNAGEAAKRLAFFAPFPEVMAQYGAAPAPVRALAFYMTAKPNRFVKTNGLLHQQLDAILCHRTQFPQDSEAFKSLFLYLKLRSVDFGLRSLKGRAEGFRVLGQTHMHCLPEAGQ
ncbi:MAG: PIG-L family deacetylase [Clostridia bacterium]|nr:PIG-L family deacetylase [Clostridia bacterium]MBQ3650834.1 PIG-L family deacetylase [Clostridia bacterium]MBQ9322928.1 PIG-L family deacetylase [Clostridia bacterium]MBR0421997.1 PIG-L family deacetylase [Clostridia bacterium]